MISLKERFFTATWIYIFFLSSYSLANHIVSADSAADLTVSLDRIIPFVPEFVYPFYLLYGFVVFPSFLIRERRLFYRTAAAFSVLIALSVIIFFLFPVYVPRPEFIPDNFSGKLVLSIYRMDRPVCGFPSLHVSVSLLAALAVYRNSKAQGLLFFIMFFLTSAATLFIKQHVVLDVVGGIAMALLMDFVFIGGKFFSIRPFLKSVLLILPTGAYSRKRFLAKGGRLNECVTAGGTRYDLYEPGGPASKTFIVIHGLTLQGEKDERLVAFSEKLALSGIRTAAISLAKLKQCRFDVSDAHAISDLAAELTNMYGGKTGVIGFSFGASLALVAAAGPKACGIIDPMILFGPYYNLKTVQSEIGMLQTRPPVTEKEWDNYIWIRLVSTYQQLDSLKPGKDARRQIQDMLTHYCHEPSLAVKRNFYETTLKHIHLEGNGVNSLPDPIARMISPEDNLRHIQSRVFIIHDYHDALIPSYHSRNIFQELKNNGGSKRHKVLITPLLSHVTPRTSLKVFDIFPLINIFAKIFE